VKARPVFSKKSEMQYVNTDTEGITFNSSLKGLNWSGENWFLFIRLYFCMDERWLITVISAYQELYSQSYLGKS